MITASTAPRRLCGLDQESYVRACEHIAFARLMELSRGHEAAEQERALAVQAARARGVLEFAQLAH